MSIRSPLDLANSVLIKLVESSGSGSVDLTTEAAAFLAHGFEQELAEEETIHNNNNNNDEHTIAPSSLSIPLSNSGPSLQYLEVLEGIMARDATNDNQVTEKIINENNELQSEECNSDSDSSVSEDDLFRFATAIDFTENRDKTRETYIKQKISERRQAICELLKEIQDKIHENKLDSHHAKEKLELNEVDNLSPTEEFINNNIAQDSYIDNDDDFPLVAKPRYYIRSKRSDCVAGPGKILTSQQQIQKEKVLNLFKYDEKYNEKTLNNHNDSYNNFISSPNRLFLFSNS